MGTSRGKVPSESAAAIRVGPDAWEWLTAADHSGRVGGHFRGGVNVVFGTEALVSFQSPNVPIHPCAFVADFPWEEVAEGAPVTISGGELSIGRFVLPLAEAEVVDLTFHPPANVLSLEELRERVTLIEQLIAESPDPFKSEFDRAFVRDRDRILGEWQETGNPAVLLDLIGRGPGTTPAGDDTLIGLLAGLEVLAAVAPASTRSSLHATCHGAQTRASFLLQATRHMLRARPLPRTGSLSAQLLKSAAAGRFPAPLLEVQSAILDETASPVCLVGTVSAALATGQTTGKAVLGGLIAAHPPLTSARGGATRPKRPAIRARRSPQDHRHRTRAPGRFGSLRNR